jgi:hypothetical protein
LVYAAGDTAILGGEVHYCVYALYCNELIMFTFVFNYTL